MDINEEYKRIRKEFERKPDYIKEYYNANFATSKHSKKLTLSSETLKEKKKRDVEGYLEWLYGESLIYSSIDAYNNGNPYNKEVSTVSDMFEEFDGSKVKITIEEIE